MNKLVETINLPPTEQPASLTMLQQAIHSGMEPDKLLQFYEIHERFEAAQAKKEFIAAKSAFIASCPIIERTKRGHNSKYAGLSETLFQIKGLLTENGLAHSWRTSQSEHSVEVTCVLTHVSGHSESTSLSAPPDDSGKKSKIQSIASTVSYLERYTLYAILGLTSTEMDNDGADFVENINLTDANMLISELEKTNADTAKFLAFFGISDITELPKNKLKQALDLITRKQKSSDK